MANEIEEIKSRLDLVELVGQYVSLKKAGTNYKGVCPFHNERTPSLMVSPEKQIWKCFGCGKGGDHFSFIMEAEHLEFADALRLLAQKAGVTLQPKTRAEHQSRNRKETLYAINKIASQVFHKLLTEKDVGKSALKYLRDRGVTDKTIATFQIGVAPKSLRLRDFLLQRNYLAGDIAAAGNPDKFFERIMFPIFDVLGNVVAFTGRTLTDAVQPKYLNSPETPLFNKGRLLYGLNWAKGAIKEHDYVVLVEGQMDVVALHQAGVEQTVASSGTAITQAQLEILSKYTPNFLLAFDNDSAGLATTKKVITLLLGLDLNAKVIDFSPYKDAGELFQKEPKLWRERMTEAKEAIDWWIDQEMKVIGDLRFIENKKKLIKAMMPVLQLLPEATRTDHYVQRLALATQTKPESIYQALAKTTADQAKPENPASHAKPVAALTNEEQLLAILLAQPIVIAKFTKELTDVVWQSQAASRIAGELEKWYSDPTLVKNQSQFFSRVKTSLDSPTAGKIDSWLFSITAAWPELTDELAAELVGEKLGQLGTKRYEQAKDTLALAIRRAQESGDATKMKELMKQLNTLTKGGNK